MIDEPARFLAAYAPSDVREAITWLLDNGYVLSSHRGDGLVGAEFISDGQSLVRVTVDRSYWTLAIAAAPGSELIQYDLARVSK